MTPAYRLLEVPMLAWPQSAASLYNIIERDSIGIQKLLPDIPPSITLFTNWLCFHCVVWQVEDECKTCGYLIVEHQTATLHVWLSREVPRPVRDSLWSEFVKRSGLLFPVLHCYFTKDQTAHRRLAERRGFTFSEDGELYHGQIVLR